MRRSVLAAVAGLLVGIGATYAFVNSRPLEQTTVYVTQTPAQAPVEPINWERILVTLSSGVTGSSERAAIYQAISQTDLENLEEILEDVAAQPPTSGTQFLLNALFMRAAELDPRQALMLLSESGLDLRTTRLVGLQLVGQLGTNANTIAQVIAAVPQLDEDQFWLEAIAELSLNSPEAAFQLALSIEDERTRRRAVDDVAIAWGEQDAHAALAYAGSINDSTIRERFLGLVLRQLAHVDLQAANTYINSSSSVLGSQRATLTQYIADEMLLEDPRAVLDLLHQVGGDRYGELEFRAIEALVRQDPMTAFIYSETMPAGGERLELRRRIAMALTLADPDAALAWIQAFRPIPPELASGYLNGLADSDPMRAIELSATADFSGLSLSDQSYIMSSAFRNADTLGLSPAEIGDRVLMLPHPQVRTRYVTRVLNSWSRRDPQAALDWVVANHDQLELGRYGIVSGRMAETDPAAAIRHGAQLPPAARDMWVDGVVGQMAVDDPIGTTEWIGQFRGEPIYETVAAAVIGRAAAADPAAAVGLFDTLSPSKQIDAASDLVQYWARRDHDSANNWIYGLPAGPLQDAALRGLAIAGGNRGPDPAVWSRFSSDAARQEAVIEVATRIGRYNPVVADSLIDQYLTDPELHR